MEKLLSIEELSEILGITKATIYSWTYKNKIPYIKLSKRLLKFRESEILEWISKKSIKPPATNKSPYKNLSNEQSSADDYVERIIRNAKEEIIGH